MVLKFGNIFISIVISCLICQVKCHSKRSIDLIAAHSQISEPRLLQDVAPRTYRLRIQPLPDEGIFNGVVSINMTWKKSTDTFTLHADNDLQIPLENMLFTEYVPDSQLDTTAFNISINIPIKKVERDSKKPLLTVQLGRPLSTGSKGEILLAFSGKMSNDTSEGLFRHEYIDTTTGERKWYVASHFRPTSARKVFPCFDEPSIKALYRISIGRQKGKTALSNMPLERTDEITDQPGWFWDHFQQTPKMSTFSVGIVVSEFVFIERNKTEDDKELGLDIKVWARSDYLDLLTNVTDKIIQSLKILQDFWNTPYPLPKLDCIALPNYQAVKPADNWGLILFRETELMSKKSWHISQELVYQWLGQLTTPTWWNEAYLNNALNRYITAYTTLQLNYGNETFNNWPLTMLYSIYYEFSKRYPHGKATAVKQDSISAKTELLFRMLNYTLGESTFKHGLQKFMADYQYKTFSGIDVWRALDDQGHFDSVLTKEVSINAVASSWLYKDRLPVITIIRNYENNTANVTQRVYLRERPHDVPDADKLLWWIPIVLVEQTKLDFRNTTPVTWMRKDRSISLESLPSSDNFIIVNPEEIGPFPVNYDTKNWNMLANFLADNENRVKIPVNTRAKLLHDAWNLAYAGDLSFETALDMTTFLKHERDYIAWDPIFTMIDHIGKHIDGTDTYPMFQAFIRHLLEPLYIELGSEPQENESDGIAHLRSSSKTFLCQAGYKPCFEEAQAAYKKWMDLENPDEGNPVPNQYICPVFQWGSRSEWMFGLRRVINFPLSRKQNERTYLLKTLAGCPRDPWKINKLLNITIIEGNGNFSDNDISLIFSMLSSGSPGYTTLYVFLKNNWDAVKAKLEPKTSLWNGMVNAATANFKTRYGPDLILDLYEPHKKDFGTAEIAIERSMRNVKEEAKWSEVNLPVITSWLDAYLKDNNIELSDEE